jgi:zinc D-Ala-D-Ala dipeptidase
VRLRARVLPAVGLTALLSLGVLLSGCLPGGSGKPQTNVPPPPLLEPKAAVQQRLLEPVVLTSPGKDPAPSVQMLLATTDTGLGKPLYDSAQAVLRRETAERLQLAEVAARKLGYSLRVLDAARTRQAQRALFAMLEGDVRYLDPPSAAEGTPDTRGAGVDVTLVALKGEQAGQECPMGSLYMERTDPALRATTITDKDIAQNRARLSQVMTEQGFIPGACWWDFSDPDWKKFPEITDADYQHRLAPGAIALAGAESEAERTAEAKGTESGKR